MSCRRALVLLATLTLLCDSSSAQWIELEVPDSASFQDGRMFDNGQGILISDSSCVYATTDAWRTSKKVDPPGLEKSQRFIPRELDTSASGVAFVVGYTITNNSFGSATTYAMMSRDRGMTWSACGMRMPGRFQSVSFRAANDGVVLHEYYQVVPDPTPDYAMTMLRVDEEFATLRVDTVDSLMKWGYVCNRYTERRPSRATKVDDNTTLISCIYPCYRSLDGVTETTALLLVQTLPDPTFHWIDYTRSQYEAFRSFVPPVKPKVLPGNIWAGIHGRSTRDAGATWENLSCRFIYRDSSSYTSYTSASLASDGSGQMHMLGTFSSPLPHTYLFRTARVALDVCGAAWDSLEHVVQANNFWLEAGFMPFNSGSSYLVSYATTNQAAHGDVTQRLALFESNRVLAVQDTLGADPAIDVTLHADQLVVRLAEHATPSHHTICISDLLGRTHLRLQALETTTHIETSVLTSGSYVVSVYTNHDLCKVAKVVVAR